MLTTALVWLQVTALCTTCATLPVLPRKFPPPTYSAVIAFVPGGREAVSAVTLPLANALVANGVPLAEKITSPVGRSAAGGTPFTEAVNVTFVPSGDGFSEEAS